MQRLASRPEGHAVQQFLQLSMTQTNQRLARELDAVVVRHLQGHAQVLDILLRVWKP